MDALILLIPLSLILAGAALAAFLWTMRSGQYEDLDAVAYRILFDDDAPRERRPSTPPNGRETQP